jgi:hypothetical protein
VLLSENITGSGAVPVVEDAVKAATGITGSCLADTTT